MRCVTVRAITPVRLDARKQQRDSRKRAEQRHHHATRAETLRDVVFHGRNVGKGLVRIERLKFAFDGGHERERVAGFHSHQQHVAPVWHLFGSESHLRPVILLNVVFAGRFTARAGNHTDDCQRRRILFVRLIIIDLLADRVFAGKYFCARLSSMMTERG